MASKCRSFRAALFLCMAFCVIRYIVEIYHSVKNFNKPEDREVLE